MPTDPFPNRHEFLASPNGLLAHDDPWCLRSHSYPAPDTEDFLTTLFSVGNGNVGLRNAPLGSTKILGIDHFPAIVNGFYESWPIHYPELAYGFATSGQTLLACPNPTHVEIEVDGISLDPESSRLVGYERSLDMQRAIVTETSTWLRTDGSEITVAIERFVSFTAPNLVAMRAVVAVKGDPAAIVFRARTSTGRQLEVGGDPDDPRRSRNLPPGSVSPLVLASEQPSDFTMALRTAQSELTLAMVSRYSLPPTFEVLEDEFAATMFAMAAPGEPAVFERATGVVLDESGETVNVAIQQAQQVVDSFVFDEALSSHSERVASLWEVADIVVDSTPTEQQAIRYAIFQLIASGICTASGIPAKGLSSNGYEGHFFWDTEMFMVPFWHHVMPERARHLLGVRHTQLPIARAWAQHLRMAGALFAWRTINGHEASAYYPAGTAQIHLNADIAYAVDRYLSDYPNDGFAFAGAEILIEVARFFVAAGFVGDDGFFHLHGVTGPDEYTAIVDDNYYTNRMAQHALLRAAFWFDELKGTFTGRTLVLETGVESHEAREWARLGSIMYLPIDDEKQIRPQDASFLSKQRWMRPEGPHRPLLLEHHPLTIYRHQILKQPDVVLADFLFEIEEDPELLLRNFAYYDPLTTGDSSLSAAIQAAMAARVGHIDYAMGHLAHALFTDLDNLHSNTRDGIHVATAGSIWQALVWAFAGIRSTASSIRIDPRLPERWASLRVPFRWRNTQLFITVAHDEVSVENHGTRTVQLSTASGDQHLVEGGGTATWRP